jgi:peptidoglycan/xylan/chitin deacetylase (PgdA/CDA1 family)
LTARVRSAVGPAALALAVALTGGCAEGEPSRAGTPTQRAPTPGANEAGEVPVLAYHRVRGDINASPDLTISPRDFRRELEYLRRHGYHPVNFADLIAGRLDVPAGKTPVVLTFDDSSDTQFTFVRRWGRLVPDPGSAVGVLLAFHAAHPDWPLRGTFFAAPWAPPPNNFFGEPHLARAKLRSLLAHGFEIGLHTYTHANLGQASEREVVRQLALNVAELERHTGRDFPSLALPYGVYPANEALLRAGRHGPHAYRIDGAADFDYTGERARPPYVLGFDPYHVPRIPTGDDPGESRPVLRDVERSPGARYVSDGDSATVTVPRRAAAQLDRQALRRAGKRIRLVP